MNSPIQTYNARHDAEQVLGELRGWPNAHVRLLLDYNLTTGVDTSCWAICGLEGYLRENGDVK